MIGIGGGIGVVLIVALVIWVYHYTRPDKKDVDHKKAVETVRYTFIIMIHFSLMQGRTVVSHMMPRSATSAFSLHFKLD